MLLSFSFFLDVQVSIRTPASEDSDDEALSDTMVAGPAQEVPEEGSQAQVDAQAQADAIEAALQEAAQKQMEELTAGWGPRPGHRFSFSSEV